MGSDTPQLGVRASIWFRSRRQAKMARPFDVDEMKQ
jgi:hypothetical protein